MIEPSEDEVTRFEWLVQAAQDALPSAERGGVEIPITVLHVRLYPRADDVTACIALDFSNGEVTEVELTGAPALAREYVYADLPNNAPKAWWYALDNAGWMRDKVVRGRFIAPLEVRRSLVTFPVEGPLENPSPAMPEYETIVDWLERFGVILAESQISGKVEDKVVSFLSYIQQALHALPESVQGDLSCEYNFPAKALVGGRLTHVNVCLVWCDDEMLEAERHEDGDPWNENYVDDDGELIMASGQRVQLGKVYLSVSRRESLERVEEPAYVAHRDVMAHGGRMVADDMIASGQWTYPTTSKGNLVTTKSPGYVIRAGPRAGQRVAPRFRGTWQFIGAWHPGWKSEKDARHWLPEDQGGAYPPRHRRRPR